ncbi:MAG TPA: glycine cleavage system aminomethyltransferase GcvT [Mycobacteriales bacterium]|nr:glycine cleavage system aminomethyltransferase GcvT [Mycobacteriales bacterium]
MTVDEAVSTGLTSPLHERHLALGAKLGDFGGWQMPLQYSGVLEEHTAVREAVGVFDVSHLGKGVVRGHRAGSFINSTLTNDLGRIGPGQAQYTLCCDDATGGVVDDLIAYLHGDEEVLLVPNAANTAEVVRRLSEAAPAGIEVEDLHRSMGVLAVQGPRSGELLDRLGLPTSAEYMAFTPAEWNGRPVVVCRSGYTGEHGYELLPRWDDTGDLWDALLKEGEELGVKACGLGARDTLRTEMGYPLHGQDLSLDITPVQARCGWAVGWSKPRFWGRDALVKEKADGPRRMLWGLRALDRGIPRAHMPVLSGGTLVGEVTSGTFSPTLRVGIGLALLESGSEGVTVREADEVEVDVRGKRSRMQVVKPPFVRPSVK